GGAGRRRGGDGRGRRRRGRSRRAGLLLNAGGRGRGRTLAAGRRTFIGMGLAHPDLFFDPLYYPDVARLGVDLRLGLGLGFVRRDPGALPLEEAGARAAKAVAVLVLEPTTGTDDHWVCSFRSGAGPPAPCCLLRSSQICRRSAWLWHPCM